MLDVDNKKHVSVLINSFNKIYKNAKINGTLDIKDLYFLDIINKLLGCKLSLSNNQKQKLISIYNKISFSSDYICSPTIYKEYIMKSKNNFIQAEIDDCNTYESFDKIFYWQEQQFSTTNSDVVEFMTINGYLNNKKSDSYLNFSIGKDIDYKDIGRICFLAMNTLNTNVFRIFDSQENDVTHTFTKTYIQSLKSTLFVSANFYSIGNMKFKIKKIS